MSILKTVSVVVIIVGLGHYILAKANAEQAPLSTSPSYLQSGTPAPSQSPETISLDGKEIPKTNTINALLQAALIRQVGTGYSTNLLPAYVSDKESWPFFKPDNIKQHFPWLETYLFSDKGAPRGTAIAKWEKPIRISLGLPNDLKPYNPPLYNGQPVTENPQWPNIFDDQKRPVKFDGLYMSAGYGKKLKPEAKEIVSDEAKSLAPILANLTGLPVEFVAEEGANPNNISNVRIVLMEPSSTDYWATKFKRNGFTTNGMGFRQIVEDKLQGLIPFTPSFGSYQVDGFWSTPI